MRKFYGIKAICLNPSDAGIDSLILYHLRYIYSGQGLNPSDAGIDSLIK